MNNDIYVNFLHDFGFRLREEALLAKRKHDNSKGTNEQSFHEGYLLAFILLCQC